MVSGCFSLLGLSLRELHSTHSIKIQTRSLTAKRYWCLTTIFWKYLKILIWKNTYLLRRFGFNRNKVKKLLSQRKKKKKKRIGGFLYSCSGSLLAETSSPQLDATKQTEPRDVKLVLLVQRRTLQVWRHQLCSTPPLLWGCLHLVAGGKVLLNFLSSRFPSRSGQNN